MSDKIEDFFFDLNALKSFIFEDDNRNSDVEVTETLASNDNDKLETVTKVIREVKSSDFSNKQTIRYDLMKMFIEILNEIEFDEGSAPMTLGQQVIFNTLLTHGIIKSKKA